MQRVAVINVVGLSSSLIGDRTPKLRKFAEKHGQQSFRPAFPALTTTGQSSMLTGICPREHGIVGNGWYDREAAEVKFWKQSNHLVKGEKVWEALRRQFPGFTCAKLFWWYNMYSSADFSMTPRPLYLADGKKVFDIHTHPMGMREEVKKDLGEFPFTTFWGPNAGIPCSQWIAASARWIEERESPGLSLVYLPHLDYGLQKFGPGSAEVDRALEEIDAVVGELLDFYAARDVRVLVVSEYGISPVSRQVHLNRLFRQQGWIQVKDELGRETLDAGMCQVFAVADHQVAHVYVKDPSMVREVRGFLDEVDGVAEVRAAGEMWGDSVATERGGDLVAVSDPDAWFTYYYWDDDARAPDFARTVDIHRKPGYDPAEMFMDPTIRFPKWVVARFLLKKKLGLRGLLEIVPLDGAMVRGSHGRDVVPEGEQPVVLGADGSVEKAEDVFHEIIAAVAGGE